MFPVRPIDPSRFPVLARRLNIARSLTVQTSSGRVVEIPSHHSVFVPLGGYADGEQIDPMTAQVRPVRAGVALAKGMQFIFDNRVETVEQLCCF